MLAELFSMMSQEAANKYPNNIDIANVIFHDYLIKSIKIFKEIVDNAEKEYQDKNCVSDSLCDYLILMRGPILWRLFFL